jgi:hypothetical protein
LLEKPFFLGQSVRRDGCVKSAGVFSRRNANLGRRAGFPDPPTMNDYRAQALFSIGTDASLPVILVSANRRLQR